jgi:hypothetical protein
MSADPLTLNLLATAAAVAVVHTAVGPDHTLPFVMLARARRWTMRRTLLVTGACGLGHVASSLLLGGLGVVAGVSTRALTGVEEGRGSLAAWAMVAFGAAYAVWGLRRAWRRRRGIQVHEHAGEVHVHAHGAQRHGHDHAVPARSASFWTLFLVFVLGPCEPLIPLFLLPASEGRWALAASAGAVFTLATLATMLALVAAAYAGVRVLPLERMERWTHSLAGAVIAASGLAVIYGGL